MRSSYCAPSPRAKVLAERFLAPEQLRVAARDRGMAGVDAVDTGVMDLADPVVAEAASITDDDLGTLRDLGRTDTEIRDVIRAVAARASSARCSTPPVRRPTRLTPSSIPNCARP